MIAIDYAQLLRLALPEVIVVATALIVMAADLMVPAQMQYARPVRGCRGSCLDRLRGRNRANPAGAGGGERP